MLVELVCERATLRMEEREVTVTWADGETQRHSFPEAQPAAQGKAYWGSSHGLCISDFYHSLRTGAPFPNDIPGIRDNRRAHAGHLRIRPPKPGGHPVTPPRTGEQEGFRPPAFLRPWHA